MYAGHGGGKQSIVSLYQTLEKPSLLMTAPDFVSQNRGKRFHDLVKEGDAYGRQHITDLYFFYVQ